MGILSGIINVLVALDFGTAPKIVPLGEQSGYRFERVGGYIAQALAQEEGGFGGCSLMSGLHGLHGHLFPAHARMQRGGVFVIRIIADIKVDATIGGDED